MADFPPDAWITTTRELKALAEDLRGAGRFAFDTEFISEETFEPILCLIQVATPNRLAVIDPLRVPDLGPMWNVLHDPAVEVVMHASGEDLRICRLQSGRVPPRIVDVQIAAGLAGFGYPLSLSNLVYQALGISVRGGETRTDWRRRPLSPNQLRYALDDVRYLLELADLLNARLKELGRLDWAESEYRDLVRAIEVRDDELRWRRLPGIHQLNRQGLEIARRLAEWRRNEAKRTNRPLRQFLRDDLLLAIAKRQPTSRHDLEALRDFRRSPVSGQVAKVLAIVAEALAVPPEALPEPTERYEEGPGLTMTVNLLSAALNHCCSRQGIAYALVGTSSDLKDLIRWHTQGRPGDRKPALVGGWRGEVCGQVLLDVLAGRLALRIVDPEADPPIALNPVRDQEEPTEAA